MNLEKQELFLQADQYLNRCIEAEKHALLYQIDLSPELEIGPTFSQQLFSLIKKKGISETECYKRANIDRRLFSKIRTDDEYQPKKITVFALIFGLKLDFEEAKDLLDAAGYAFSHSMKMDILVEFLIKKKVYDLPTVNELLHKYGCPLLGMAE